MTIEIAALLEQLLAESKDTNAVLRAIAQKQGVQLPKRSQPRGAKQEAPRAKTGS